MPKIVILGSCRFEPYIVLLSPNKLNPKLYECDHEEAYRQARKKFHPAIREADEVWVYAPDGIGKHTHRDMKYAVSQGKVVRIIEGSVPKVKS